jgi:hypothetical protein
MEESMAKIKVHELAKELELQSKDILNFLQEKGIEAKAAQSSLEEDAAGVVDLVDAFVRKAAARKPDLVDARETERVVAHDDVGREVLPTSGRTPWCRAARCWSL